MPRRAIPPTQPGEILEREFLEPLEPSQYRVAKDIKAGDRWCRVWIGQEIRALFEAAGVERPRNAAHTLHMLRGRYAVRLLQGGADLEIVRQLPGHANIAATAIYLSATSGSRRRALLGLRQALD